MEKVRLKYIDILQQEPSTPVALPACNYYLSPGSRVALTAMLAALQTLANSIEHDSVPP